MLTNLKKAALAIDIKSFSNSIWPSALTKTPLLELNQFFYNDATSVEKWAEGQIKACQITIESHNDYINGIKVKKKISAADKKTIEFWENAIIQQHNQIQRIKNALMARKKTMPVKQEEPETLGKHQTMQAILKLVEKHNEMVTTILNDYLVTDGAELEIGTAGNNLWKDIEQLLFTDNPEEDFEALFNKLKNIENDLGTVQLEELSTLFTDSEVIEFVEGQAGNKGYALIKVETMDQQEKLRHFAETELWPAYNQQLDNILI
jgi:hypothetical protein